MLIFKKNQDTYKNFLGANNGGLASAQTVRAGWLLIKEMVV